MSTERYAREDLNLQGVMIPRGGMTLGVIGSANRDESVFENAEQLDVTREPNKHLSFGQGIHFCVGAPLLISNTSSPAPTSAKWYFGDGTTSTAVNPTHLYANVGTYTLLALRQIGSRGMVISYEPTPRAFEILKNNVQVNAYLESGRIDLRQKAVSDLSQVKTSFFVPKNCMTHSSFYRGGELASNEVDVIEVETVSLDDDLGRDRKVDVIKIDAEGAEPEILRGMRHIIDSNQEITIFIEFAPQHLVRANVDPRSFLAEIRSGGFDILQVMEPTGNVRAIADEELCESFSVNLMLRKTKAV